MKRTWIAEGLALPACLIASAALGQGTAAVKTQAPAANVLFVHYGNLEWQKVVPELGERSPEFAIVHVDPATKTTQMMIRVPKDSHVPMHWHAANETHTVVKGTFIIECEGKRDALEQGAFNSMPARMHHEAWTRPDEGALVFVTYDGPFDFHWVNGTPKPADVVGGRWR